MTSAIPAIEVRGVHMTFEDRRILAGVDLVVRPGERMVILGSSGGGKSTLLRVMLGAYRPNAGEVLVFGRNITTMEEEKLNELRRRWGVVFQGGALYNSMTVGENVALPLRENTMLDDSIIDIMVRMKLDLVGLNDVEDLKPAQLSGGMAKRVSLARAIALDPEILFFDEPTTGLDPVTGGAIMRLMNDLASKTGATSVIVTQDMRCAFDCADRIALLHGGRVHAVGRPEEIRASTDPLVRQFINGEPDGPIPFRLSLDNCAGELRAPLRTKSGRRPRPTASAPQAPGRDGN
ncbi:MAG TPA: ABC transporter ATP-binding protein [Planctomycetota bacterium]|nr:ABC transporter ATP-binding protein [Planctomycetota bacterium]